MDHVNVPEIEESPCGAKRFGDCLICDHENCGWCPDCSPGVPGL